jgi:hypothetical protein
MSPSKSAKKKRITADERSEARRKLTTQGGFKFLSCHSHLTLNEQESSLKPPRKAVQFISAPPVISSAPFCAVLTDTSPVLVISGRQQFISKHEQPLLKVQNQRGSYWERNLNLDMLRRLITTCLRGWTKMKRMPLDPIMAKITG